MICLDRDVEKNHPNLKILIIVYLSLNWQIALFVDTSHTRASITTHVLHIVALIWSPIQWHSCAAIIIFLLYVCVFHFSLSRVYLSNRKKGIIGIGRSESLNKKGEKRKSVRRTRRWLFVYIIIIIQYIFLIFVYSCWWNVLLCIYMYILLKTINTFINCTNTHPLSMI